MVEGSSLSDSDGVRFKPNYVLKTVFGKLRVAQLVFSLLSGATASGTDLVHKKCSGAQFQFQSFISWAIFVNVLVILILHLLNLHGKLHSFLHQTKVHLVLSGAVAFVLSISSSLTVAFWWCGWRNLHKGLAITSAVFGFACVVLFSVEFYFHFKDMRSSDTAASPRPK